MIEDTLNRTGLGDIWLLDGSLHNTECIKDRLQLRLNDILKQEWLVSTCTNRVCTNYTRGSIFKETLEFEEYLITLDFKYMKNLCKFRCRSHNLPVNNGRFIEVTQADLKCTLCKNGDVGDEYHYLCVCSYFNAERTKFIGNGMIINSLTYKHLLNSRNASTLKQISKFIGIIFSKFVYSENIDRDVILLRQNVVTSSGRTVIRPTRLDL